MNRTLRCAACALVCLGMTAPVAAGNVAIEWRDPGKYRDIRAGNEGQHDFEERVTEALTRSFEDAAADHLPPEQTLRLTITDVDLAGDVEYFFLAFPQGIRVMRDVYFPSISFTYELLDANGELIARGNENIRDMGYRFSGMPFIHEPAFNYEDRMIHDWIARKFD